MELRERERKIDINKLSTSEIDNLSQQIGDKVKSICDETAEKVNSILKIYGMSAKIAIQIDGLYSEEVSKKVKQSKNGKKRKQDNLKRD